MGSRDELLPKYEREVERLEAARVLLRKEREGAKWFLVGLVLVPPAFWIHRLLPAAVAFTAIGLWGITLYLTTVRLNERDYELERAQIELERLRRE